MSTEELLWVPIGTEAAVNELAHSLGKGRGRNCASPGGRLLVIERKLGPARQNAKHLWLQIIVNPWEIEDKEPTFDLLNIDQPTVEGFSLVDEVEGRFRFQRRDPWVGSQDLTERLVRWLDDVLETVAEAVRGVRTRPAPRRLPEGLRFPHGIMVLEKSLVRVAEQRNLVLRTENEHRRQRELHELEEQNRKQRELELAAKRKLAYEELLLTIQSASDRSHLDNLEAQIPKVLEGTTEANDVLEALAARRDQLKPQIKPMPDWDDPSFTSDSDNNIRNKRGRARKGIRTFDSTE